MDKIKVDYGSYTMIDEDTIQYEGENTDNGICYKDLSAWHNNKGVIYIGEYELLDYNNFPSTKTKFWTKESWVNWVKDYIITTYNAHTEHKKMCHNQKFIEHIAYLILQKADWSDLSTLLDDYENDFDFVETQWEEWIT